MTLIKSSFRFLTMIKASRYLILNWSEFNFKLIWNKFGLKLSFHLITPRTSLVNSKGDKFFNWVSL